MPYPRLTKCMPDERRHNPFQVLHKALRHGHCRLLSDLGAADFGDEAGAADLVSRLAGFLRLDRAVLAATATLPRPAEEPPLVRDQSGHLAALSELDSLMRAVAIATPQRRPAAGRALYRCFALFAACDMARMDGQETALLGGLHQAYGDEQLRAMESEVFRRLPAEELESVLRLMLPALSPPELEAALGRLQNDVGPARFATLFQEAVRPLLTGNSSAAA